jgi:hypothetical protein
MIWMAKIALGMVGVTMAGAGVLCSEGLVTVDVQERQPEQHHIFVVAPALLAPIAVHYVPKAKLSDASAQIQLWLPVIRASLSSLRDSDDVTLVEVKDERDHVTVKKSGGSVVVDVEDGDDTVHVSAPIRAISSTVEQLAAADSTSHP